MADELTPQEIADAEHAAWHAYADRPADLSTTEIMRLWNAWIAVETVLRKALKDDPAAFTGIEVYKP
jgi:hypothetical protein